MDLLAAATLPSLPAEPGRDSTGPFAGGAATAGSQDAREAFASSCNSEPPQLDYARYREAEDNIQAQLIGCYMAG